MVATMKRQYIFAVLFWDMFLSYEIVTEIQDMCFELHEIIADADCKRAQPLSRALYPNSLNAHWTEAANGQIQKTFVVRQLREVRHPANIPLEEANILVQMAGSMISSYWPVGD